MKLMVEALLNVRPGPRPDPLPENRGDAWAVHAPYMLAFLAVLLGAMLMKPATFGVLACGAGAGAIIAHLVRLEILRGCRVVHYSVGLLMVGFFLGPQAAGAYALPAGLFLVLALGVRAAAAFFTPAVAQLAGRVPWRFEDVYRRQAFHFGVGGITASLVLVAFCTSPVYRVLGVAVLPLTLRTYLGQMLSPDARRTLWSIVAAFEALALLVLLPSKGMMAAPWLIVACETVLFVGSALIIAERTGVNAFPRHTIAAGAGAMILIAALALPGSRAVYILLAFVFGGIVALISIPRRPPDHS